MKTSIGVTAAFIAGAAVAVLFLCLAPESVVAPVVQLRNKLQAARA